MSKKKKKVVDIEKSNIKKEQRNISITIVISVIFIILVVCGFIVLLHKEHSAYDTVVFKVGEEKVRKDEINLCILQNVVNLNLNRDALGKETDTGMSADAYYKQEILGLIMDYKVESMIAKKQGITLSENEEQEVKNNATDYIGKTNARVLNELGISKDRVIEIYMQRYLAQKLEEMQEFDIEVDEQKFVTIYTMLFPKVVMADDGNFVTEEDGITPIMLSDEEIEKQKKNANAAYKELTEEDADVDELAKKYGVDIYSGLQSNLLSNIDEPFQKYAEELKDGECSPVFEIESCYGIVKMINSNNQEIADQIINTYKHDREQEELKNQKNLWYQELGVSKEPKFVGKSWEQITLYDFVKYVE